MTDNQQASQFAPRLKHPWRRGFAIGLGLVLLGLLVWFFVRAPAAPVSPEAEKASQTEAQAGKGASAEHQVAPAVVPTEPTALVKSQLEQVLAEIKEAHQKKDLSKLLSYYSPNFPGLTRRTQSISKAWKIYDYPKINCEITDIMPLADNAVMARITWDAEAKNINNQKSTNISKTYLIKFVKESGQWRIQNLETVK